MIAHFFDPQTFTLTYVVYDPDTRDAVIIDPVLDYEPMGSTTSTASVQKVVSFVEERGLRVRHLLETHAHADHISASQYLKRRFGAPIGIGDKISVVQETFKSLLDLPADFRTDGGQFDRLFSAGEKVSFGSLHAEVLPTPGHTPACISYRFGDAIFVGDALFIEDYGTGRCDFPGGNAEHLYRSVHDSLYALPEATRIFVGHDYQPGGRALRAETTVGASRAHNVQLQASTPLEAFVRFRTERDKTLTTPRLLFQSIQVNIAGGLFPKPHPNGTRYLKVPINVGRSTSDDGIAG